MFKWNKIPLKERKQKFKDMSRGKSLLLKNAMLRGIYEGLECLCISAGTSTSEFEYQTIKEYAKNKPMFTIKTSTMKYKDITDVCITNYYASFHFPSERPYMVLARQETPLGYNNWVNKELIEMSTFSEKFQNEPDILWGSDITARHSNSVVNGNRWVENEIENSGYNRIIGPGLMNDMVVPIMVHCGIKKINILGWDGAKIQPDGSIKHFYDNEPKYKPTLNYVSNKFNLNNLKSDTHECEQQIAKRGEESLLRYLVSKGIEINILTKHSEINSQIKRNYTLYGE